MKKSFCLALMAILLCSGCQEKEGNATIANPNVPYESLQEINDLCGTVITAVEEAKEESYIVIDQKLAQYSFYLEDGQVTIRATRDLSMQDISGIYDDGPIFDTTQKESGFYEGEEYAAQIFRIGDVQYSLAIQTGDPVLREQFRELCDQEYIAISIASSQEDIIDFLGNYDDEYSGRATLTIEIIGKDAVVGDIVWGDGASAYEEWLIPCSYKNETFFFEGYSHIRNDELGIVAYEDTAAGVLTIKDGKIYFDQSNIDALIDCVFQKGE